MAPFCIGSGITMGTNGLQWAGDNPEDDCVMLWTQTFGITSAGRAVIASITVFLMALLAQFLTSRSSNRIQDAKELARQQRMASATVPSSQFYDPEQGKAKTQSAGKSTSVNGANGNESDSSAHPPVSSTFTAVPATITSVSTGSRSVPAPPLGSRMSIPASTGSLRTDRTVPTSFTVYASASAMLSGVNNGSGINIAKVSDYEHLCDSLQHGLRIFIAYLLMLAAMTYDIALLTSIVGGFTIGYFVFAKDTSKVPISADPCCS